MNTALLSILDVDPIALLSPKALGAWRALETRYALQITRDELDHLFALYMLGLTTPFYGEVSSQVHIDACRVVLALALDEDRVDRALRNVPPATHSWVEKAFLSIEHLGAKDSQSLFDQQLKSNQTLNAIELTPSVTGGAGETA
ncbi:hypothetical protein D9M70_542340 [compost metagenome]